MNIQASISAFLGSILLPLAFPAKADQEFFDRIEMQLDGALNSQTREEAVEVAEKAIRELRARENELGNEKQFYVLLGYLSGQILEDNQAEVKAFSNGHALDPKDPEINFMLGQAFLQSNQFERALPHLQSATEQNPLHEQSHSYLGFVHESLGSPDKAEQTYKEALRSIPESHLLRSNLADFYLSQGKHAEALPLFEELHESDPTNEFLHWNYGQTLQSSGESEKGLRVFLDFENRYPGDYRTLEKICQLSEETGNQEKQQEALDKIRAIYQGGQAPEKLKEQKFFIRDQFVIDRFHIFSMEYFELTGDRPVKFSFYVTKKNDQGEKEQICRITLGSYESANQYAQERGEIPEGVRRFHMDTYYPDGSHETLIFFNGNPGYAKAKEIAVRRLKNEIEPLAFSQPIPDPPE